MTQENSLFAMKLRSINKAEKSLQKIADEITASIGSGDFIRVMDAAITRLGVELTSQRARTARDAIKHDPKRAVAALAGMVAHERLSRELWLTIALEPWCKRHGITIKQGISILFDDAAFNPITRKDDLPTREAVFSWGGQQLDFANYIKMEIEAGVRSV